MLTHQLILWWGKKANEMTGPNQCHFWSYNLDELSTKHDFVSLHTISISVFMTGM